MDNILTKALKDRQKLVEELHEVDAFIRRYRSYAAIPIAEYLKLSTIAESENSDTEVVDKSVDNRFGISLAHKAQPGFAGRRRRAKTGNLADIMEHLIRNAGHPLERSSLVDLLEARDVEVQSSDKPRYLGTILWRHRDRFKNLPGHGYWMKDMPYPPASYDPEMETESASLLDEAPPFLKRPESASDADSDEEVDADEQRFNHGDFT